MTEVEAVRIAQEYVQRLLNEGVLLRCEFTAVRFIPGDDPYIDGMDHWVVDFDFTVEEAAGLALHVIVDDATAEVSLMESL